MTKKIQMMVVTIIVLAMGFAVAYFLYPQVIEKEVQVKKPPITLPSGAQRLSPCFDGFGNHWGRPQDLGTTTDHPDYYGPEYGYWEPTGQVTAVEYHSSEAFMKAFPQKNKHLLGPVMPALGGDYQLFSIWYSKGHPRFEIPHYDIHNFLISQAEREKLICPKP